MADAPGDKPAERAADDSGRERLLRAAYEEFSRSGTRNVGVDAVIAKAGVAKMTLYRNFPSKDDLVVAFLARREDLWTNAWLRAAVMQRASEPRERLLAVFDVLGDWFETPEYEGCSFIRVLLETTDTGGPVHDASVRHLENIRDFLRELATAAGIAEPDAFARQWHILVKGAIVAALEGDTAAAGRAREIGTVFLDGLGATG